MQMEGMVETRRCQSQTKYMANVVRVHATAGGEGCRQIIEEAMYGEVKKDQCRVALNGGEHDFWRGTEAGMLGLYNFQGAVLGGDWSRGNELESARTSST